MFPYRLIERRSIQIKRGNIKFNYHQTSQQSKLQSGCIRSHFAQTAEQSVHISYEIQLELTHSEAHKKYIKHFNNPITTSCQATPV